MAKFPLPESDGLIAEIALLRNLQMESMESATFFGWTPEAKADYKKRADRMEILVLQLAKLDKTF